MTSTQPVLPMSEQKDSVETPSTQHLNMAKKGSWDLIHDLKGGTEAMRKAGSKWLPKEEAERQHHYEVRLARSFLFGGYSDATERLVSKPFSKSITIQGELPEKMADLKDDVDETGRSLTQLAIDIFRSGLDYGLTHILVDFPRVPEGASKADEEAMGVRPLFVQIKPTQLLGWRFNDKHELTQIRYMEEVVEDKGNYSEIIKRRVKVLTTNTFEVWDEVQDGDKKEFKKTEEGTHTFGRIPLVTCYFNQKGFMTGLSPFLSLAWINLDHWQSTSDYKNILRILSIAILFGKGFTEDEVNKGFEIGPRNFVHSTNTEANLSYVEHGGNGIEALKSYIESLEEKMVMLGLQPLMQKSGNVTATAESRDESKSQSLIQTWIRTLEKCLERIYQFGAEWLKVELPEDFKIDIFNDFGISIKAKEDITSLLNARQSGQISHQTFLREIKRRGLLSEGIDIEEEIEQVELEGPALGTIGENDGEEDDDA